MFGERPALGNWRPAPAEPTTFGELYSAAVEAGRYADNTNARFRSLEEAYDARIDAMRAAGVPAPANPLRLAPPAGRFGHFGPEQGQWDPEGDFTRELARLAEQFPQHRDVIGPDRPFLQEATERARGAETRVGDLASRYDGRAWVPRVLGGFRAAAEDPFNIGTVVVGPMSQVQRGAAAVIWNGIKTGAANAGVELAMQPQVQSWRRAAGLEAGWREALMNTATAFAFGFGVDAGGRTLFRGGRMGAEATGRLIERVRGRGEPPATPSFRPPDEALDQAARDMPGNALARKAADGDADAMHRMARQAGVADDPAIRGAEQALEMDVITRLPPLEVDEGEHLFRAAQALRNAVDPMEPLPGDAVRMPPATRPSLADDAPTPRSRFSIDNKPVEYRDVDLKRTVTDANVFQFKSGGDAAGANGRLQGVERWDPIAAGRAVIFERADGALVIADAHQRRGLAMRLQDQETAVPAFVFREADGWTPADVRALAAKKNLQEGTGTVVDAARVIRERPDIVDDSMPMGSEFMRQARSLARLSDEAFGMVGAGVVPPNQAALIGDLVHDKSLHAGMMTDLAKAQLDTAQQARLMVGEMLQVPSRVETQLTLLGEMTTIRSLMPERVRIMDAALKMLKSDGRVFALLGREGSRIEAAGNRLAGETNAKRAGEAMMLQELMTGLGQSRGQISAWLTEAAQGHVAGRPVKQVADEFVGKVRTAVERDGLQGLMADVGDRELRPIAFKDPVGPEARAQVDGLALGEHQSDLFGGAAAIKREIDQADVDAAAAAVVKECKA